MHRLLVVAADASASETIRAELEQTGAFDTAHATSVPEAAVLARRDADAFDAVLLMARRPGESPPLMCARLRQAWPNAAIVILARHAGEHDVVRSLDAGASDFIAAPHRPLELQARLRAQIRAHANRAGAILAFGPYRFHPATRVLEHAATRATIRLTPKEADMVKYLHRAAGQPVARETLLRQVWGYEDRFDSFTVESHIYRLRRKIETDPSRPRFVVNEDGGYALVAPAARPWDHGEAVLPLAG